MIHRPCSENVHVPFLLSLTQPHSLRVPAVARFQRLTIGLRSPFLVMLLGFETWRINGSYAAINGSCTALPLATCFSHHRSRTLFVPVVPRRSYLASSGFHIGIRPPLVLSLSLGIWRVNASERCKSEIIKGNYDRALRRCHFGIWPKAGRGASRRGELVGGSGWQLHCTGTAWGLRGRRLAPAAPAAGADARLNTRT
jgi:hypothetical protein